MEHQSQPRSRLVVAFFASVGHAATHLLTAFYFVIVLAIEKEWGRPYSELIQLWTVGSLLMGIGLVAFSQSVWLPLSLGLLVVTGFGFMTQMASSNTILQTIVDDDKRGRIMSLFTMSFIGMAPFQGISVGIGSLSGVQSTATVSSRTEAFIGKAVGKVVVGGVLIQVGQWQDRDRNRGFRVEAPPAHCRHQVDVGRLSRHAIARQLFRLAQQAQARGWSAEDLLRQETQKHERAWRRQEGAQQ